MTLEKRCSRCRRSLPVSEFRANDKLRSGLDSWCLDCRREASREWRMAHRDECNERRRVPPSKLRCVECGGEFEGRKGKLICSRRCKDRRYARLHPEELREKQRRKYARRLLQTSIPESPLPMSGGLPASSLARSAGVVPAKLRVRPQR